MSIEDMGMVGDGFGDELARGNIQWMVNVC